MWWRPGAAVWGAGSGEGPVLNQGILTTNGSRVYRDFVLDADATVIAYLFFRRAYTGCYALTALPAISLPCGFTTDNLPIGLQLGAGSFAEELLLGVAHAYEQATPWHTRRALGIEG